MAENLRVSKFRNGVEIMNISDAEEWSIIGNDVLSSPAPAWCYNNNDPSNNIPFGKLYNWYAVSDTNKICPSGWHIPTNSDWNILIKHVDVFADTTISDGAQSQIGGGHLKSIGNKLWIRPNIGATNSSGFSAVGGGFRASSGVYSPPGIYSYWWSTDVDMYDSEKALSRNLEFISGVISYFPM